MRNRALYLLRLGLNNPGAEFRDGQRESIAQLLSGGRLLVVQRTGWGKSVVYFIAAKLLREQGKGTTLLISPLLSLMRNQLEAAQRMGVIARTINSSNVESWQDIRQELLANQVDILMISPERLANENFHLEVLGGLASQVSLFVIDEAHCISDWGHDFRPDYRRIRQLLTQLPQELPILATTATANDRVVNDIVEQLGQGVKVVRGPLVRESLSLQNLQLDHQSERLAWLAEQLPKLPGSGIIYVLTQRDAERVAEWLRLNQIQAEAYHADLGSGEDGNKIRNNLEQKLLYNEIKALVATVALGMGFDKPDLGFVIHFQRPASVVHYYQQVGRAGRAVNSAFGIMLSGAEDENISNYFIETAFPPQRHVKAILELLRQYPEGLSAIEMQRSLNITYGQLQKALRYLSSDSPAPIQRLKSKWLLTAAAAYYCLDEEKIRQLTELRYEEQAEMRRYLQHPGCLMEFLEHSLDDPAPRPCGKCANCRGRALLPTVCSPELARRAQQFLRGSSQTLSPRLQWPPYQALASYGFRGKIKEELRAGEGRALCIWRDGGWGQQIAREQASGYFSEAVLEALVQLLAEWRPEPAPGWVCCVPSLRQPYPIMDLAARLAQRLNLPFIPCIRKVKDNQPQRLQFNSVQRCRNLDGAFYVDLQRRPYAACLLLDDTVETGWTMTLVAALLRQAGAQAVHPLVLALNNLGQE
ncbi:MAG: RecQ family ATP-dependent DNA helicase [Lentisphaeria bacterium]